MKRLAILGLTVLLLMGMAAYAGAVQYSFFNITNNGNADVSNQLLVDVMANGAMVDFMFTNAVGIASSITDVYFDDGTLLAIASISNSAGVAFAAPASPGDLPSGNTVGFQTTQGFSADSDHPVSANGVDAAAEWLTIAFTLQGGQTFADTIAALNSGELRIGLHVQAIGPTGGSDSYVNDGPPSVPEPSTLLLLGFGLTGVGLYRRMRK